MKQWNRTMVGFLMAVLATTALATMRDPTQPPGMAYAIQAQRHAIDLQGIYFRQGHAHVLIDGEYKVIGDRVGDATITDIRADKVVLTGDDGPVELDMSYPVIRQPVEDKRKHGAH